MLKLTQEDLIFATGVFLKPVDCIINGIKQWRWVVVGFEDDSYFDGEAFDVYDYADNFEGLFKNIVNEQQSR